MSAPRTLTVPSTLHVTLAGATLTSVLVFVYIYVYEIYLVISVWTLASKANWLHTLQDGKFEIFEFDLFVTSLFVRALHLHSFKVLVRSVGSVTKVLPPFLRSEGFMQLTYRNAQW